MTYKYRLASLVSVGALCVALLSIAPARAQTHSQPERDGGRDRNG
jgi:hypothetical protein